MNPGCLPDDQLLALATDEPGSDAARKHVERCAHCQMRVKLLHGEIAELRSLAAPVVASPLETVILGATASPLANTMSIGRYVIVDALGSGGQADVYRVIDPDLGRDLVLKLSHRQSSDGEQRRDALRAEGRLLAQLDHPGLVRVFETGVHDDRPFLVLDYVPGRNLEQIYAGNRPSVPDAAQLIAEVARVVAYTHRRGVVHGDITPRNILIDSHGRARLIDFGLSKIEDAWREDGGLPGGTPAYLPPEIAYADRRPGNFLAAGDVFGLGATLYWLLTGHPPFSAPTTLEALSRARHCDIDFGALERARVPPGLVRACRQALAADPGRRPTPEALADELLRATRRRITPRVVAAIAAIALAGFGLYWSWSESHEDMVSKTASIVHSVPTITVDGNRILSNVLPLRSGDRITVHCNISRSEKAIMLWLNAAGELKLFEPARDIAEKVDRMVYPAPQEDIVLESPEGTEMIFFCRGEPVSFDELLASFPVGKPLPVLPPQNYVELLRDEVKTHGPLERSAKPSQIHQIEAILKEINRSLKDHFQGVSGIAFPHRSAGETE